MSQGHTTSMCETESTEKHFTKTLIVPSGIQRHVQKTIENFRDGILTASLLYRISCHVEPAATFIGKSRSKNAIAFVSLLMASFSNQKNTKSLQK